MPRKKGKGGKTTLLLSSILKKQVVDADGEIIGTVEDIIVTLGGKKPEALLAIRDEEGKDRQISFTDVSAISEVVLLSQSILEGKEVVKPSESFAPAKPMEVEVKTEPPPPPATKKCTNCGYENHPGSKFCIKCGTKLA